jgi:hypothetical protein
METTVLGLLSHVNLGTNATVIVQVGRGLGIEGSGTGAAAESQFKAVRELGTIVEDTDLTFSLRVSDEAASVLREVESSGKTTAESERLTVHGVPVQVVLKFTASDGTKMCVVHSSNQKIVTNRDAAEADGVDSAVVAVQAVHESARLAQGGDYVRARVNLVSVQRLLQRAMKAPQNQRDYLSYIVQAEKLDQFMREAQAQAAVFGTGGARDDEASKAMYQMKTVSVRAFTSHQ